MMYGSGEYDQPRNFVSSPVPRTRPEATHIASKHQGSGMYACLNQPRTTVFGRSNQNDANMENGPMRHAGIRSPILVDPVYNGGKYSNRSARPVPRVKPEAAEVAEKSKGSMGTLFGEYGKPDPDMVNNLRSDDDMKPDDGPMRKVGLRSPILTDPIYKENYTGRTPRPAPRVRPEASDIATKAQGSVAKLFTTHERRYNEMPKPKKEEDKNHTTENVKRMRQIQRETKRRAKEREAEQKTTPVKALWKSSQYDGVESRVKPFTQHDPPQAPRPDGKSPSRPSSAPARSSGNADPLKPKQSLTPRPKEPTDFVARNARAAKSHELRRSKSQLAVDDSQSKYREGLDKYNRSIRGKTPSYLQSRQKTWAAEERERIRNQPDPTVPPGHTVLPDSERRQTLATLRNSQQKMLEQHRLLPVRSADSIGVRNRKTELERRILEVDEAIKVFERPRVFVRLDE